MCVSKQHCGTLGRSSRALWHASLDCCGGTTLASTGAREGGRADSSGLQATHNNVQERRRALGPWAVGYPDAGEVWPSMKICRMWPSMGRLHTKHEAWPSWCRPVAGARPHNSCNCAAARRGRELVLESDPHADDGLAEPDHSCWLAHWGHASFKLRVARQRVKVPPYVADLRCCPFARTQAEDGAGRASKAVQPLGHTTREGVQIRGNLLTRSL